MFTIRIADINICIQNRYEYVKNMCSDYITDNNADFTLAVSDEEIQKEKINEYTDAGYAESLAIYRKIAEKIISQNGFLMHAAVFEHKKTGVAFLAKSGTGKSTHAALWEKLCGKDFIYINGDKPLIRVFDGKIYAYGTPWAGKENFQSNRQTELKKICFIRRSSQNKCVRIEKGMVLESLMNQIYIPENTDNFLSVLNLISTFIKNTEFYTIDCNVSDDAAKTAYEVIFNEQY